MSLNHRCQVLEPLIVFPHDLHEQSDLRLHLLHALSEGGDLGLDALHACCQRCDLGRGFPLLLGQRGKLCLNLLDAYCSCCNLCLDALYLFRESQDLGGCLSLLLCQSGNLGPRLTLLSSEPFHVGCHGPLSLSQRCNLRCRLSLLDAVLRDNPAEFLQPCLDSAKPLINSPKALVDCSGKLPKQYSQLLHMAGQLRKFPTKQQLR